MHIFISIIIIVLGHYLWDHFTTTGPTKPVSHQSQKYKQILSELQTPPPPTIQNTYLSPEEKQTMIDELKQLLIEPFPQVDVANNINETNINIQPY
jgi:hypothetical protein